MKTFSSHVSNLPRVVLEIIDRNREVFFPSMLKPFYIFLSVHVKLMTSGHGMMIQRGDSQFVQHTKCLLKLILGEKHD